MTIDEEREAYISKFIEYGIPLVGELKKLYKRGQDVSGTVACPACGKPLAYSISGYNGHISARCETEDCLQWVE